MVQPRADKARASAGVLLVVPALVLAAFGLAKAASAGGAGGGITAADAIRFELTVGWAAAGVCLLVRPGLERLGRLVALAALLGAVVLAAAEMGETSSGSTGHAARFVATLVPALLMAVGVHFLPGGARRAADLAQPGGPGGAVLRRGGGLRAVGLVRTGPDERSGGGRRAGWWPWLRAWWERPVATARPLAWTVSASSGLRPVP